MFLPEHRHEPQRRLSFKSPSYPSVCNVFSVCVCVCLSNTRCVGLSDDVILQLISATEKTDDQLSSMHEKLQFPKCS